MKRPPIDARVATPAKPNTYSVDATRLAALRQETEQVSALLAGVFQDEDNSPAVQPAIDYGNSHESQELLLPGLDAALDSLLREILRRASWSRQELEAMAEERQIMLDGALEQINEAAFDLLGESLTEGDDPITVQQTILENAEL